MSKTLYVRYSISHRAPIGFTTKAQRGNELNLPLVLEQELGDNIKYLLLNIHYNDRIIEITGVLPFDGLNRVIYQVSPNGRASFDYYTSIALEELFENLNHGYALTQGNIQPTTNYQYNDDHFQWSILPLRNNKSTQESEGIEE